MVEPIQPPETVQGLVRRLLGVNARANVNPELSSVGTSPVTILREKPNRVAALLINLSLNRLYVGPNGDVSSTKGIRLDPGGASLVLVYIEDFDVVGYEWFAVADAAGSPVYVVEYLTH